MKSDQNQLERLARLIQQTSEKEIDCERFLETVAPFLYRVGEGLDATEACKLLMQHVRVCPECKEELVAIAQAEGIDLSCLGDEI